MNTKHIVLLGGFVTMSLLADTHVAPAASDSTPTMEVSAESDRWQVRSDRFRPTWLVRPRPAGQRASIT